MSHAKTTIMKAMRDIHSGALVLPGIQRDFVWEPERIYALLDSILRGYPFGTLLYWNTKQRVQFRGFTDAWAESFRPTFDVKQEGKKATLVLDGQQRLQSLYLAIMGSYDHQVLYFDLLSGEDGEDVSEAKYYFEFLSADEAEQRNGGEHAIQLWVRLHDVVSIQSYKYLTAKAAHYQQIVGVAADREEGQRLAENLSNLYFAFNVEELLTFFTIDPEYGEDSQSTSLDEVLEIFVRVNSGGEVLTKSDLMFSLMQLKWEGAADLIADLCDSLNDRGRFEFDKDFVLKCALVCTGQGARYEVAKLRKEGVLDGIREAFPRISGALIACVDFIVNTARFHDGRILGSYNTLIPFAYYCYLQGGKLPKDESTRLAMNQALYLALMTRALSRYADYRIDRIVRDVLNPAHAARPGTFPLAETQAFVRDLEGVDGFDDALLQRNVPLLMNILEGGTQLPEGRRRHRPEYDHIFPQSRLRQRGYAEEMVNHYANFRLISKSENIWKRDEDPAPYFDTRPDVRRRYLVPREFLTYEQYPQFIEARRELIWERMRTFLGITALKVGVSQLDLIPAPSRDQGFIGGSSPLIPMVPSPANEGSGGGRKYTVEALCQRADEHGIGEPFRRILEGARRLGLHPRPHKNTIVYAPPQDGRLFLFSIEACPGRDGSLRGWISPESFREYLDVSAKDVANSLWPRGGFGIAPDEVDSFVQALTELLEGSRGLPTA